MKKIILLRHSKSSWKDSSISDYNRPLNNRGKKDAPFIAKIFNNKNIQLDLIISSGAKRASDTAKLFAESINYKNEIVFKDDLYLPSSDDILQIIKKMNESFTTILVVCHNPGITDFSNYLCNNFIENIPTSGMVGLNFKMKWKELVEKSCMLEFFEYPKKNIN
jgi:phosphohistidine phosphatase